MNVEIHHFTLEKSIMTSLILQTECTIKLSSMKQLIYLYLLLIPLIHSSCNKNNVESKNALTAGKHEANAVSRKIEFSLYTNKDFKNDKQLIQFSLFIRNANNQLLWDSMLPLMSIQTIPSFINKLFIEKQIPVNDSSLLRAGFIYAIENVGISWHLDTCNKSTAIKKIDFNFQ